MTRLVPRVSHEQSGGYTLLSGPWRRQHAVLALGGSGGGGGHVHSSSDPLLSVPMAPGLPWEGRRNRHTDWPSSYLRVCTQVQGHRSPKRMPAGCRSTPLWFGRSSWQHCQSELLVPDVWEMPGEWQPVLPGGLVPGPRSNVTLLQ